MFGRSRLLTLAALGLVLASGTVGSQGGTPPDLILTGGKIVTVDAAFSIVEAVAITGNRFTAAGSNASIERLAGPATRRLDLRGRTVIPGLADDHLHNAGGGPGVDLSKARSLGELLSAVAARVKESQPGDVVISNADWHEAQLKEQRLPSRKELDAIAPAIPVVLVRGGHEYIVNSRALTMWNITKETPQPSGGRISRDESGDLNGELVDSARSLVQLPPQPKLDIDMLIAQHRKLNAAGLTSIRYAGGSLEQYRLLKEMRSRGLLTIRVSQLMPVFTLGDPARVSEILSSVKPDEGDEWVRIGGVKLLVDGGFEGGWMREPYAEPWGERGTFRGLQMVPADKYTAVVKEVNRLGWRAATHAVGDAAIDQVLDAYEAANAEQSIVGKRWAVEHGFIARADQIARMKRLGIVLSAQDHLYLAGPVLTKYWGPQRAARTTPVRDLLDGGVMVAGGTDSSVVPYPPLWAIYHFVTRDTISGGVMGTDQKITRQEALRLETFNNAYLTFEETIKGSIEPGKLADLVVLSDDILTCPEKAIESMSVELTMVGGKIVYER